MNMNLRESAESYLGGLFTEYQRFSGAYPLLFYSVKLTESDKTREEYRERASDLRRTIHKALQESGNFRTIHVDMTIDPYIALADASPDLALSEDDQHVKDLAERDRERRPWPEDVGFDTDDLLAEHSDPLAAQEDRKNIVAFEITAQPGTDTRDWGEGAAIENVHEVMDELAESTEDIESAQRWYPHESEDTYAFASGRCEFRVQTVIENGWPRVEWKVGPAGRRGRGTARAGVVDDEEYGLTNGRLYFESRNEMASEYIDDEIESIPMPESIAEALIADAREGQREAALERELSDEPTATDDDTAANGTV